MLDENILCILLSMGFKQDDCERVLNSGVLDIEDAIQLLLRSKDQDASIAESLRKSEELNNAEDFSCRNEKLKAAYNDQLRKRRLQDHIAKDKVLKDIQDDRLRQKNSKKLKDGTQSNEDSIHLSASPTSPSLLSPNASADQIDDIEHPCRIQVGLPTGDTICLSLERKSNLQNVLDSAMKFIEDQSVPYSLLQPFPRRAFKPDDMVKSLDSLSLYPSARLVILASQSSIIHSNIDVQEMDTSQDVGEERSGCSESRLLIGNVENSINDDFPVFRNTMENQREFNPYGDGRGSEVIVLARSIDMLKNLSAHCVAIHLAQLDSKIIHSMSMLSPSAASQVLEVLKSQKMLTSKVMSYFLSCKLKEVRLDGYVLATNELFEKLRFHGTVSHLSLKSCSVLNDKGLVTCLKGMHLLKHLNVADCCRLSGNILKYIIDLSLLEVLILDKVKVGDDHISEFLQFRKSSVLKKLSLGYCPVTSDAFSGIIDCSSLLSLTLNNSEVSKLSFLQHFPNLYKLNLQNTRIASEDLKHVGKLKKLITLKINGTSIYDIGLRYIQDLQLLSLNLPSRLSVSDETIKIIKGLPLECLDLSSHINLTDTSIPFIGEIVSLTTLSLSNTKITDEKLIELADLKDLHTLDLSKTSITNSVSSLLQRLISLHTVNLAWTNIDDGIIVELNACNHLIRLNMSHNNISDKGIVNLKLDSLKNLILDSTEVTWNGAEKCIYNCQNLTVLRNVTKKVLISNAR